MEAGAEIYEQTPVTLIERQGDEVVLTTPGGIVRADKVVLATNAYTHLLQGLKGMRSRQFPMWTSVIVTERLTDEQWASIGWKDRQAMEDVRQLIHYFRPTADGRILIGGQDIHAPYAMHNNMDHDHNPPVWRGLEDHLKRMFPSLRDVNVAYRWCGAVSVNADMTPALSMMTTIIEISLLPAIRRTKPPMMLATPVWVRPLLRMKTAQTVMTAGLLQPDRASAGVTSPVTAEAHNTSSATISMGIHSVTKNSTAAAKILSTKMISGVIMRIGISQGCSNFNPLGTQTARERRIMRCSLEIIAKIVIA